MSRPSLLILYGSQTGNAQDAAERVAREARRRQWSPRLSPADVYFATRLAELPHEKAIIFVVSTTGQGDPPYNFKSLWRFLLRKSLAEDSLSNSSVAVFGLGDSGYPQYNVMAKKVYRRLLGLGATSLCELGLGDDQNKLGYEAELDVWLPKVWAALHALLTPNNAGRALVEGYDPIPSHFKISYMEMEMVNDAQWSDYLEEVTSASSQFKQLDSIAQGIPWTDGGAPAYGPHNPYLAKLTHNQRITSTDHFQDVRLLHFDISSIGSESPAYQPGDVLAVVPVQRAEVVGQLCRRLGLDPAARLRIQVSHAEEEHMVVRLGALIAGVVDVSSASPRKFFFEVLSRFTSSDVEKERLEYFTSPEGVEDLYEYNQREGRTLMEVLGDFKSATIPLEWLLEAAPRLKPRYFSIASSQHALPGMAQLAVAVVKWKTPLKRLRHGLCSSMLAQLEVGNKLPVWLDTGALRLPTPTTDTSTPILMVGPGTGVAPFRAFLQERRALKSTAPCLLFFGCRNQRKDYYFKEEWEAMMSQHSNISIISAFSRDQNEKVYVQDKIREFSKYVWSLIESGAYIYVAGSAHKMPRDVESALSHVMSVEGGLSLEECRQQIKRMQNTNRYQVEVWS